MGGSAGGGGGSGPPPRRGLVIEGAMLRRSASTGDRRSPPSSSSSSCAAIVSHDPVHAPSHGAHIHHRSALPPELGFSPTGRRGHGSEEGGAEAGREGEPAGGLGSPGRAVVDELAMRHQHLGGARDGEGQQPLNFPDVLQVRPRCLVGAFLVFFSFSFHVYMIQ